MRLQPSRVAPVIPTISYTAPVSEEPIFSDVWKQRLTSIELSIIELQNRSSITVTSSSNTPVVSSFPRTVENQSRNSNPSVFAAYYLSGNQLDITGKITQTGGESIVLSGPVSLGSTLDVTGTTTLNGLTFDYLTNALQVGGTATKSYSRFGSSETSHENYISAINDVLVSGDLQVIGTGSFNIASASQYWSGGLTSCSGSNVLQ